MTMPPPIASTNPISSPDCGLVAAPVNMGTEPGFVYEAVGCAYPLAAFVTDDGLTLMTAADDTTAEGVWQGALWLVYE